MNKRYYEFGNPFKVKFRTHTCYRCGTTLSIIKNSKIINKKSEEAKYYDFTAGIDGGVMVGSCEFTHRVFYCPKCLEEIEFVTQLSFEDIDDYIRKLKRKYLKKGLNLEIKKSYGTKDDMHLDKLKCLDEIRYLYLNGYSDGVKIFTYQIPMMRKNSWERPYFFKLSAKKQIK